MASLKIGAVLRAKSGNPYVRLGVQNKNTAYKHKDIKITVVATDATGKEIARLDNPNLLLFDPRKDEKRSATVPDMLRFEVSLPLND